MIARKTVRELWPLFVIYAGTMLVILVPAIVLWPDLKALAKQLGPLIWVTKGIKSPLFREIVQAMSTYSDYYALQVFFKGANVCGAAAAVLVGTGLIARERESHTLEFLLTRPISRSRILFSKFSVAAVGLVTPVFLVGWAGILLSRWLVDEHVPFAETTIAAVHCSIFLVCILALTTVCSVIFRLQAHTAAAAGLFVVIQTALYLIQTVRKFSFFKLSDIEVYGPIMSGERSMGQLMTSMQIWMLLAIAVLYLTADRLLRRIAL